MLKSIDLLKLFEQIINHQRDSSFFHDVENNEYVLIRLAILNSEISSIYNDEGWFSISNQDPKVQKWIINYLWNRSIEKESK